MSSNNSNMVTPRDAQKAKRWRVQRLIKLGEWVESRQSALRLAANSLFDQFDQYMNDEDAFCRYTSNMMEAIEIINDMQMELRVIQTDEMPDFKEFNGKVVLIHRNACKHHREEVLFEDLPHEQQQTLETTKDEA
jgi:hypothetical protein|tara:strand:+ start:103 stop:507 length:405 start_codon:yes stop_codon:yes gene_type:complete